MCNCKCSCGCPIEPEDVVENPTEYLHLGREIIGAVMGYNRGGAMRLHLVTEVRTVEASYTWGASVDWVGAFRKEVSRKPKWTPEKGKLYMFSDDDSDVGTAHGVVREFRGITHLGLYSTLNQQSGVNGEWKYCWPVPTDNLGK